MRFVRFPVLLLLVSSWLATARGGDDVSRQPPEIYAKKLAPLLTPLEEVLKAKDTAPKDGDGVILLQEELHWITPEGGRILVSHAVNLARTDAGAAGLAEHSEFFRKTITKPHVAVARTILADGTRVPVDAKGMLLHSPQPDADSAIYGDSQELRIVFPNVKPGVITESIVVMEQSELMMPGELMTELPWNWMWPEQRVRLIVDAPESFGPRLKAVPVGMAAPQENSAPADPGRVRREWSAVDRGPIFPEPEQPSVMQTGPLLAITTLGGWEDVTRWFAKLAGERSAVPEAMAKEFDKELKEKTPKTPEQRQELLAALMRKVADDVRYTGMELGVGAYQPREPEQVWTTRYGDCKDKSNLLRVLLARHGIKSWLALVNTRHDGRLPRECPSIRWFNHVILAVDDGKGGFVWCDPTIKEAPPGMLGTGAGNREVLLMRDEGAMEWVHTPEESKGTVAYEADLKPRAEGGWTGSLTISAEGISGIGFKTYFSQLEHTQAMNVLRAITEGIVPHAELIDFKQEQAPKGSVFAMKVYLDVPGSVAGQFEVRPPRVAWPEAFSRLKTRKTDLYQDLQKRSATLRYSLPAGQAPADLPGLVKVNTPGFSAEAKWQADEKTGAATATITWETKRNVVSPDDYADCHSAAQTLLTWTDKNLPLVATKPGAPTPAPAPLADEQAIMPSGEGQLAWIDRHYPQAGDVRKRRSALERIAEFYPQEHGAVFTSLVLLAALDLSEGKSTEAVRRLREAKTRLESKVTGEDVAWCDHMLAGALQKDSKRNEAWKLALEVFERKNVSEQRRAVVALFLSTLTQGKEEEAKAVEVLRQSVGWQSTAQAAIFQRLTQELARRDDQKGISEVIAQLYEGGATPLQTVFAGLPVGAAELVAKGQPDAAAHWLDLLEKATPKDALSLLKNPRSRALAQLDAASSGERIRARLAKFFEGGGLSTWQRTETGYPSDTADEALDSFNRLNQIGRYHEMLNYGARRLVKFKADEMQAMILLRMADTAFAFKSMMPGGAALFEELLGACDMLPPTHDVYLRARILRAESEREQHPKVSESVMRELLARDDLPTDIRINAIASLSHTCQILGRLDEAASEGEKLLADISTPTAFLDLIRTVLVHVQRGDYEKACALADKLREIFPNVEAFLGDVTVIRAVLKLTEDHAAATAYWKSAETWWPEWDRFEKDVGVDTSAMSGVPFLSNPIALGQNLRQYIAADNQKAALRLICMMARGARGLPMWSKEVTSLLMVGALSNRPEISRLQQMCVSMLKSARYPDATFQREADMLRLMLLMRMDRGAEGLPLANDLWKRCRPDDAIGAAVARGWVLLAQKAGKDLDAAIAALSMTVAAGPQTPDHELSVSILATALVGQRKFGAAADVLRRALDDPASKDAASATRWREQLESLRAFEGNTAEFGEALKTWVSHQPRLAWLDYVSPKELTPEEIKKGSALLDDTPPPGSTLKTQPPTEVAVRMKRSWLLLTSKEVPFDQKLKVCSRMMSHYLLVARSPATDISGWVREGLDSRKIPDIIRVGLLSDVIYDALRRRDVGDATAFMKHPLAEKLNPTMKAIYERHLRAQQCDLNSQEAAIKLIESLEPLQDEFELFGLTAPSALIFGAMESSQPDLAESLVAKARDLSKMHVKGALDGNLAVAQMQTLKEMRAGQEFCGKANAMWLKCLGPRWPESAKSGPKPQVLCKLAGLDQLFMLSPEKVWPAYAWMIAHWPWVVADKEMMGNAMDYGREFVWKEETAPGIAFVREIVRTGQSDTDISNTLNQVAWALVDWNNKEARTALLDTSYTVLDFRMFPKSRGVLGQLVSDAKLHAGEVAPATLAKMDASTRLSNALALGDAEATRKLLENIGPSELFSEDNVTLALRAYRLCHMKAEEQIAAEKVRQLLNKAVADSWSVLRASAIGNVITYWTALEDPEAVPAAWSKQMAQYIESPYWRGVILTRTATLRGNWAEALKQAQEFLQKVPSATSFEYDRAAALMHLKRGKEARASLERFAETQADDPRLPQVRAWLKEISQG